ncbi:hypothetical protein J3F84DRAFT_381223 [Trichoderma pleuroticola]
MEADVLTVASGTLQMRKRILASLVLQCLKTRDGAIYPGLSVGSLVNASSPDTCLGHTRSNINPTDGTFGNDYNNPTRCLHSQYAETLLVSEDGSFFYIARQVPGLGSEEKIPVKGPKGAPLSVSRTS